ncbi:hypothetical protein L227DRAFT_55725 [Lentinus tigrinus ALCF2SS1-6]|uniref:Uncharacterized protein n=1 Tax=Lentinus tigrinus ALCF2SS1-6 TaxID=1328759 RepID=A0A5C2SD71_9APHY|nr:hypothetical protein L227DRAFT_55725 [Lentinus tigrinus ALCF2SS1-6]
MTWLSRSGEQDWDRRETSITYTYAYQPGRNIQVPPPITGHSAQTQTRVPVATATNPAGCMAGESPVSASTSTASARGGEPSSATDDLNQHIATEASNTTAGPTERQYHPMSNHADGLPSGSGQQQPSEGQQPAQNEAQNASSPGIPPATSATQPAGPSHGTGAPSGERQRGMGVGATNPTATEAVKTEKIKCQNKNRINLRRHENKIPKTDRYTEWYSSYTRDPLAEPPAVRRVPGMLFVHRHKHETEPKWAIQVWMFSRGEGAQGATRKGLFLLQNHDGRPEGEWVRVRPGHKHPDLPGYVLHLRETGEPSWVKASTAKAYRSRGQADS